MSLSGLEEGGGRRPSHSWRSRSKKWMPDGCVKTERSFVKGLALLRTASHSSARPCVVLRRPRTTAHRPCVVVRGPRTTVHHPCVVVRGLCATAHGPASLCEAFAQRRTASCRCTSPCATRAFSAGDSPPDGRYEANPLPSFGRG